MHLRFARYRNEEVEAAIKAGKFTFLFNDNGEFIVDSLVSMPSK
jgi:hypothetical protein